MTQLDDSSTSALSTHYDPNRHYRFFDALMVAFVTVMICSEFMAAGKVAQVWFPYIGYFKFGAGVMFFPLSYLFGDVLTEVYGYKRSRRVIWAGFASLAFTTAMTWVIVALPPAGSWQNQSAWETVFANSWRIVSASLIAYLVGEWVNSVVLAKMKIWTSGKHLWARTIGSTVAGEAVDSVLFYPLAFYAIWSDELLVNVMIANYLLKVATEVVLTPFTYLVVGYLKRVENEDFYDIGTNFSPLPGQD